MNSTRRKRAFATVLVLGIISFAVVTISMTQSSAFAQAAAGREALARARAYWAARGGVEATIAKLENDTENPDLSDAFSVLVDMTDVSTGEFGGATYRIAHQESAREVMGPEDAHAKLNINRLTTEQLATIEPYMTDDVIQSIIDWVDTDDDVQPLGAELGYYAALPHRYNTRNGPMRSIAELELVAGVDQRDVRGEDWNLNGVLDPNENDGNASDPPDNADGVLDAGWSGILTAYSAEGSLAPSGEVKLDLKSATDSELVTRIKVNRDQAKAIVDYMAANANASMRDFITSDLSRLVRTTAQLTGQQAPRTAVEPLSQEQLGALLEESVVGAPSTEARQPGKLNVNTCPAEVLQYLPELTAETADAIVNERAGLSSGFTSLGQLLSVPGIGRRQLAAMYELLCVRSNVFVVTSRGRDTRTGLEVEVYAVIDRSSLPVVIQEIRVR